MDLSIPFPDDMNYCLGWNPGNLPSYEIRSLLQDDPKGCNVKKDVFSEEPEKIFDVSDTDEEFHEFGDDFKSDISHENYEWKVPDISNNAEKHDILAEKSEETLEVSNTDEEFHGFSDVNSDITDMYMNENYERKVPELGNNTEKHDILTEKSEETLEVSNTDEEFHGFSDNDDEISDVEDLNIKGGLISENFSLWFKCPKIGAKHR